MKEFDAIPATLTGLWRSVINNGGVAKDYFFGFLLHRYVGHWFI